MTSPAIIIVTCLLGVSSCFAHSFSDTIRVENFGLPVARSSVHSFVDPDSLPVYTSRLTRLEDRVVTIRLSASVRAKNLIDAIQNLPDIVGLEILMATPSLLDSVMSTVKLDSLEYLYIYHKDTIAAPGYLRRFPTLRGLTYGSSVIRHEGNRMIEFPCTVLADLPQLMFLTVMGVVYSVNCPCVKPGRIIELGQFELPETMTTDNTFIAFGLYTQFDCTYDVMALGTRSFHSEPRKSRDSPSMPALGQRSYALHHGDSVRNAIAPGVLDRFITTLYAYVVSGERVFGSIPSDAHERFIAYAMNPAIGCDVEIKPGSIVLYNSIVYTGPLVPLMNNLLNEGCF